MAPMEENTDAAVSEEEEIEEIEDAEDEAPAAADHAVPRRCRPLR